MAAAVSDYKVSDGWTRGKIDYKEKNDLQLVPTGDIISNLKAKGNGRFKVDSRRNMEKKTGSAPDASCTKRVWI